MSEIKYFYYNYYYDILYTGRVPVERKSPVCVMCLKYRIIVLIIINISLGQISISYRLSPFRQLGGV